MTTKKVHIKCFGCQMNKLDSSLVTSALTAAGFETTDKATEADAVLINTCSVRAHAEDRVLSHLGHLKHLKKQRPDLIVAIMGCMAQRLGAELLENPAVDIVVGPTQLPQIPQMLTDAIENKSTGKNIAVTENIRTVTPQAETHALDDFELTHDSDANHIKSQAFVRVMRGCNNFCTYCVVPYVRGPEISRPPQAIIEQVKKLADSGIQQITLLGQTVNSYTCTAGDRTYTLADLLEMTSQIESVKWVRFITSHPGKFDDSILRAIADLPKVCPYLHIPAQSGSDKILKAMNRGYTAEQYLDFIDRAKSIVPDIAIAGDFIVGFPGETDEDFAATADLVKKCEYKNIFVFKYSPRPGTNAVRKLKDTVSRETKQKRNHELLEVQNKIATEYNKRFMNQTLEVLVEGLSKKPHLNAAENQNNPQLVSRTATDYIVVFNAPETLTGNFAKPKVNKTSALTLFADLT
jgi:tRNA-2-methylthio-N6-dimethylallyladenosine synthase